jgi:hypothetical protein
LLSLLPATTAAIGLIVLDQRPAWREPAGRPDSVDHCMKAGLGGYQDPCSRPARSHGPVGSAEAAGGEVMVQDAEGHSALTLRLVLAGFGLVVCAAAAILFIMLEIPVVFVIVLALLAVIAAIDIVIVSWRKYHGEPG